MFQRMIDDFKASTGTALRLTSLAAAAAVALFITISFLCAAAFVFVLQRYGLIEACLAGAVVLATNAYTNLLLPEIGIAPVRAQMLGTAPDPRRLVARPTYSDRGFRYWRQLPDGRLLAGGFRNHALDEEVGHQAVPTAKIQALLEREVRRLGAGAEVTHRWAGIMGFTADELPLVGPVPGQPGVYICGGYSGHGMGFAFQCARLLAGELTGRAQMGSSSRTMGSPQ